LPNVQDNAAHRKALSFGSNSSSAAAILDAMDLIVRQLLALPLRAVPEADLWMAVRDHPLTIVK
jgi:hypothetical protein